MAADLVTIRDRKNTRADEFNDWPLLRAALRHDPNIQAFVRSNGGLPTPSKASMPEPSFASTDLVAIEIHHATAEMMRGFLVFLHQREITPRRTSREDPDLPVFVAYFIPSDAPAVQHWLYTNGLTRRSAR